MNSCGSCSMCCKVLQVDSLGKKAGEWCRHWVKGVGCSIYESRPEECRVFECLWLRENQPPELKPESTHVVFALHKEHDTEGDVLIAHVDPARPDAAQKGVAWQFIQAYLRTPGREHEKVGISIAGDVTEEGLTRIGWARRAPR